jgi:hypothetical protein
MTKKLDPDRPNKARRGRPPKPKGTNSSALKTIWSTPEGRAMMIAKIKAGSVAHWEDRRANPQLYSRIGIPNGMTRRSVAPLWKKARQQADRYIQKMKDEGVISDVIVPDSDEAKGVAALHQATVLALGPTDKTTKLAAIRTVLEWTRSKPESKSKMTINTSEQLLALIAADDDVAK